MTKRDDAQTLTQLPKNKWAKGGNPRGPRKAKMGLQLGKYHCDRKIVAHSWRFCPFCGSELFGLELPSRPMGVNVPALEND